MRKIGNRFVAQIRPTTTALGSGALSAPGCLYHVVDVVKLSNGEVVPDDEPLFLLRARDRLAVPLLLHFRELAVADGCNDFLLGLTDQTIDEFMKFAREHPDRMKQPGVTRGR